MEAGRMSRDKTLKDEFMAKLEDSELEHTETTIRTGTMKPVLKCKKCGEEMDLPMHCGLPMDLEGDQLQCADADCKHSESIPDHCGEQMGIAITTA